MIRSKLVAGVVVAGLALLPSTYALAEVDDTLAPEQQLEAVAGETASQPEEASSASVGEDATSSMVISVDTSDATVIDVADDASEVAPVGDAEDEIDAEVDADVAPTEGDDADGEADAGIIPAEADDDAPDASVDSPEQDEASVEGLAKAKPQALAVAQAKDVKAEPENELTTVASEPLRQGWSEDGRYYYKDGKVVTGEQNLQASDGSGSYWYYFDGDHAGAMITGWKYLTAGTKWVYYDPYSGRMWHGEGYVAKDDAKTADPIPGWCYFDDVTGATQYGWKWLDAGKKWVYYDPSTGRMWHGEGYVSMDNTATNTADPIPGWCYFDDATGATQYGWRYVSSNGGKWVYYDPYNGRMWHGEGYVSMDNASTKDPMPGWCYFDDATGATHYGWKHLSSNGGKWVYYDTVTGRMWYGTHTIDNKVYIFNSTTGSVDKYGYQNRAGFYRVSSNTVWIGHSGDPFSYVTPSRIGVTATRSQVVEAFIQRAREYIGTPYVWDYSRQPGVGVDCVGLVMQCAYAVGMDLGDINPYNHYHTGPNGWHSHDANNLWNSGQAEHVSLSSRQRGDVISWAGHVAVYLGNDQIIEAYSPSTGVYQTSLWAHGTPRGVIRLFQ